MNLRLAKKFIAVAGIAVSLGACANRVPLTETPMSNDIPPDHVPTRTYDTGMGTCSMPVMGIYTDQMTGAREKYIIGSTNIPCGGWQPKVVETGFCFDKNVPRPSSRGFTYDRYGNISGQRQNYIRPQPGYCPSGEWFRYTITN